MGQGWGDHFSSMMSYDQGNPRAKQMARNIIEKIDMRQYLAEFKKTGIRFEELKVDELKMMNEERGIYVSLARNGTHHGFMLESRTILDDKP